MATLNPRILFPCYWNASSQGPFGSIMFVTPFSTCMFAIFCLEEVNNVWEMTSMG